MSIYDLKSSSTVKKSVLLYIFDVGQVTQHARNTKSGCKARIKEKLNKNKRFFSKKVEWACSTDFIQTS